MVQLFEPLVSDIANSSRKIYIVITDGGPTAKRSIATEPEIVVVASTRFLGKLSANHPKHKKSGTTKSNVTPRYMLAVP